MDAVADLLVEDCAGGAVLEVLLALPAVHVAVTPVLQGVEAGFPRTEAASPGTWRLKMQP